MHVYSLWIFDRHCQAIYHQDWSHLHASSAPSFTSSIGATIQRATGTASAPAARELRAPGTSLPGVSRSVYSGEADSKASDTLLPFDEEAKLIYGVVYSLRNMVRKVGGPDEVFFNYSTSAYTLSHLQTPSMYTFVLITDPPPKGAPPSHGASGHGTGGPMRNVLTDIWRGPWAQVAVQHPSIDCTEREERVVPVPAALPDLPDVIDADMSDVQLDAQTDGKAPEAVENTRVERSRGIDSDAFRAAIEQGTSMLTVLVRHQLLST